MSHKSGGDQNRISRDKLAVHDYGACNNYDLDDNDEDSGNEEGYDMSTCKSLIEHNVKGSFNLSAHNLICKLW